MNIERLCRSCFREMPEGSSVCPYCHFDPALYDENRPKDTLPPDTILHGSYLLGKVLGRGGFGITYIGYHLNLAYPVAIKEFFPSGLVYREEMDGNSITSIRLTSSARREVYEKYLNGFLREASTLARIHQAGTVRVSDCFSENGTAYIIMDYIRGESLREYQRKIGRPLREKEVLPMFRDVILALEEVHRMGIIHRDISPDNLMFGEDGSLTLIDFGAARDIASQYGPDGKTMTVILKPGYAPWEQYAGGGQKQGPCTDIYALCATLFRLFTDKRPEEPIVRLERGGDLDAPIEEALKKNGVSDQTVRAVVRGMKLRMEDRFQSVAELEKALYGQRKGSKEPSKDQEEAGRRRADEERGRKEQERKEREERERKAREKAEREKAEKEKAAREKAEKEKAEREKAEKERQEREKAAREAPRKKKSSPASWFVRIFITAIVFLAARELGKQFAQSSGQASLTPAPGLSRETDSSLAGSSSSKEGSQEDQEADSSLGIQVPSFDEVFTYAPYYLRSEFRKMPCYVKNTQFYPYEGSSRLIVPCLHNNHTAGISSVTVAFALWDENGNPLKQPCEDGTEEYLVSFTINDLSFACDTDCADQGIGCSDAAAAYSKSVVLSFTDENGLTWENSLVEHWRKNFEGQPINVTAYTDTSTVREVQTALNRSGYDCGTADGKAGKKTKAAMQAYQAERDLIVTDQIFEELLIDLLIPVPES